MKIQKIKPDPKCEYCNGSGEIVDWVDYGSTRVPLTWFCSCVENQADDDVDEIELDLQDYYGSGVQEPEID